MRGLWEAWSACKHEPGVLLLEAELNKKVTARRWQVKEVVAVTPGSFEASAHFYPRVLNAHIHPVVRTFLSLGNARIAKRYCHLHPEAQPDAVAAALRKARIP